MLIYDFVHERSCKCQRSPAVKLGREITADCEPEAHVALLPIIAARSSSPGLIHGWTLDRSLLTDATGNRAADFVAITKPDPAACTNTWRRSGDDDGSRRESCSLRQVRDEPGGSVSLAGSESGKRPFPLRTHSETGQIMLRTLPFCTTSPFRRVCSTRSCGSGRNAVETRHGPRGRNLSKPASCQHFVSNPLLLMPHL